MANVKLIGIVCSRARRHVGRYRGMPDAFKRSRFRQQRKSVGHAYLKWVKSKSLRGSIDIIGIRLRARSSNVPHHRMRADLWAQRHRRR